jgi:NAD(P)-dependent dehydrogenase (short-subunit alcohol dehydrogenase family)
MPPAYVLDVHPGGRCAPGPPGFVDHRQRQCGSATNLHSIVLCCKYGIPLMAKSGGGATINTGSSASIMGIPVTPIS